MIPSGAFSDIANLKFLGKKSKQTSNDRDCVPPSVCVLLFFARNCPGSSVYSTI